MAVTKALNEIEGIKNVKVDLAKGEADFDEVKTPDMDLVSSLGMFLIQCYSYSGFRKYYHNMLW